MQDVLITSSTIQTKMAMVLSWCSCHAMNLRQQLLAVCSTGTGISTDLKLEYRSY